MRFIRCNRTYRTPYTRSFRSIITLLHYYTITLFTDETPQLASCVRAFLIVLFCLRVVEGAYLYIG